MNMLLVQTCVPDYRDVLFEELFGSVDGTVAAGNDYFTPGLMLVGARRWMLELENRYFAKRRLCWQIGVIRPMLAAELVVLEYNPRVLSTLFGCVLRSLMRRPVVWWGHLHSMRSSPAKLGVLWRTVAIEISVGFIAYTETQLRELRARGYRKPSIAIGNSNVRASGMIPPVSQPRKTILYIGRLIPEKRVDLLIEGVARFQRLVDAGWILEIVGDGPSAQVLRNHAERELRAGSFRFHGHISDSAKLIDVFSRTYLGVSPGYVGLAAVHTFAHGIPMVVADKEEHAPEIEACRSGFNCMFFEAGSSESLARVLYHSVVRWGFASRSEIQSQVLSTYSVEKCAERVKAIAESIAASDLQPVI